MAFSFAAFSYISALVLDAFLIFFSIFHVSNLILTLKNTNCVKLLLLLCSESRHTTE